MNLRLSTQILMLLIHKIFLYIRHGLQNPLASPKWRYGGVQPLSPPRHDITAPEEPCRVCGLIFFLYYELFDQHVFKRVLAYFPLPFRHPGGFFPFRDPIREALLLGEPSYFYEYV